MARKRYPVKERLLKLLADAVVEIDEGRCDDKTVREFQRAKHFFVELSELDMCVYFDLSFPNKKPVRLRAYRDGEYGVDWDEEMSSG